MLYEIQSPGVKNLGALYLHYNVAFTFKGFKLGTTLSWPIWSVMLIVENSGFNIAFQN